MNDNDKLKSLNQLLCARCAGGGGGGGGGAGFHLRLRCIPTANEVGIVLPCTCTLASSPGSRTQCLHPQEPTPLTQSYRTAAPKLNLPGSQTLGPKITHAKPPS